MLPKSVLSKEAQTFSKENQLEPGFVLFYTPVQNSKRSHIYRTRVRPVGYSTVQYTIQDKIPIVMVCSLFG